MTKESNIATRSSCGEIMIPINKLFALLMWAYNAKLSVLIQSSPGIGKTEVVRQVYAKLHDKFPGGLYTFVPGNIQMIDLTGLWYTIVNKQGETVTLQAPVGTIPTAATRAEAIKLGKTHKLIIFIDEFGDVEPHNQATWNALVQEHKIGQRYLPAGSFVVAATNRNFDGASANEMAGQAKDRFLVVSLRPDHDAWIDWALSNEVYPGVIAFVKTMCASGNNCLAAYDPIDFAGGCTPRSLHKLSDLELCKTKPTDPDLLEAAFQGKIGKDYGSRYFAYRQMETDDPAIVYTDPENAPIYDGQEEDGKGRQFAFNAFIAMGASKSNLDKVLIYAKRLNTAMGASLMHDCFGRHPKLKKDSVAAGKFVKEYGKILIGAE